MPTTEIRGKQALNRALAAANPMTEAQLQAKVERLLTNHGYLYYHTWRSAHSTPGFPDLVALRSGRMLVIELKVQKASAKPTPAQERWLFEFRRVPGIEVHLWRPSDLDDGTIEEVLK